MKIPYYQIDAFTNSAFSGNPAGVCPLDDWLEDAVLLDIAAENNLSETAFIVESAGRREIRWFTPGMEVDLCGHATLAGAYVVFTYLNDSLKTVTFESKSGPLTVTLENDLLSMDFPSRKASNAPAPKELIGGLGVNPAEVLLSRDYLAVFDTEEQIKSMTPDMAALEKLDCLGIIVTAPGSRSDFVSRFFAPRAGIPEDPVTGSSHCTLIPYWSERLQKSDLHAFQLSKRGGEIFCKYLGDRVQIAGRAVTFLEGTIIL